MRFKIFDDVYCRTLQRNSTKTLKQIFTEKELRDRSPNSYIHVSVSDRQTDYHNRSAYSASGK